MADVVKCIYPTGKDATAGIEIDAFLTEAYHFGNKLTDKPSEEDAAGGTGTVTEEPDTLTVEAFIGAARFEVVNAALSDGTAAGGEWPRERVRSAFEELVRLKESRQPMDVVTGLTVMTGMVITSLDITRDAETGADLSFSVSLTKAPKPPAGASATPATEQAKGVASTGRSGAAEVTEPNILAQEAQLWKNNGWASDAEYEELAAKYGRAEQ